MLISTSNKRKANLINNVTAKTVLIIAYNSEVLSTASNSDMDNFMYYLVQGMPIYHFFIPASQTATNLAS